MARWFLINRKLISTVLAAISLLGASACSRNREVAPKSLDGNSAYALSMGEYLKANLTTAGLTDGQATAIAGSAVKTVHAGLASASKTKSGVALRSPSAANATSPTTPTATQLAAPFLHKGRLGRNPRRCKFWKF